MEQGLNCFSQDVQSLTNQVAQSPHVTHHISHLIVHPNFVPTTSSEVTSFAQCPQCMKIFDGWSGSYTLSCGHYYHLIFLIRLMQNSNQCTLCQKEIPEDVYYMFGMDNDYKSKHAQLATPGVLRTLLQVGDHKSQHQPKL